MITERGGEPIYINDSLSFKYISNLCINSADIESLPVEMSLNQSLTLLLMS